MGSGKKFLLFIIIFMFIAPLLGPFITPAIFICFLLWFIYSDYGWLGIIIFIVMILAGLIYFFINNL
jgi:hypothetical protein